jgi:HK97 family phage portal protein
VNIADGFRWLLGREAEPIQTRESDSSLESLLARVRPTRISPWRPASTREAMGVPAVFKAISLISNTIGTLSMEGYRRGEKLSLDDTPRLIIRPDPFTTPYTFWRNSAYYKARYGETWWWTARRDIDGSAMSVIPIDPRQIIATENPRDYLRPFIDWTLPSGRTARMPNEDMTWIPYLPDPTNRLRGFGPLQACGAAISVAVEAQEWAANFFGGNPSNIWIKSGLDIDEDEALTLKTQWMSGATNLPKVTGPSVESVTEIGTDPEKAQLSESRNFQNGEVALMFSMPPTLLNYAVAGSTITYQNVGQVADDLLRQCLLPHYLEPMEQAMSDLLPRATVGRFSVAGLLRADVRTRADVYNLLVPLGIETVEEARAAEGFAAGDVENRPVPFAAPQAVPSSLPVQTRELRDLRCPSCGKLAGRVAGRAEIKCRGCGALAVA